LIPIPYNGLKISWIRLQEVQIEYRILFNK
jgi:hypothetical protein